MANYSDIKYQPAGSATATYSDMAALIAATGMSAGDQALVTALNKVFMYTGTAWYLVATMTNDSPTAITGVNGAYSLATDGTATTVTAVSTDPEGFPLTWSYAVTTGSLGSTATVSQTDNVFTVTPSSAEADAGSFSITFSVTDGATGAVSAVSSFTLAFIVQNSRYTVLSVKATNTGSNQTFDDASASNHTITVAGDTTASTFSPHRHGGYSAYFDGTGDALYTTATQVIPTTTFTVSAWVYFKDTTDACVFGQGTASGAGRTGVYVYNGNFYARKGSMDIISSDAVIANRWYYLELQRDSSNVLRFFIDGTMEGFTFPSGAIDNEPLYIGNFSSTWTSAYPLNGYISDLRVLSSASGSNSSYSLPTEPLTAITNTTFLLGRLPYFKDQSTSNHAINVLGDTSLKSKSVFDNAPYSEAPHGASAYFDGTGDLIHCNGGSDLAFGTNDFTVEFWLYPVTRTAGESELVDFRGSSGNGTYTLLYLDSQYANNVIIYYHQSGARITSSPILDNAWSHVALTRSGNDVKLFVNGKQEGSTFTNSLTQLVGTNGPTFGAYHDGTYGLTGYMSDIRILNGTAAYTSNFTPPTSPSTPDSNTKFLLNPETSISDLSQSSAIKCIGNVATDATTVKFAGTKSIAFDGTGDNLLIPNSPTFGSDDFTIEGWMYFSSLNASASIVSRFNTTNNNGFEIIYVSSTGKLYFQTHTGSFNSGEPTAASNLSLSTWYHFAAVRQGTNKRLFIDGTQLSGYPISIGSGAITGETTNDLLIGDRPTTPLRPIDGYVQDVRITKGLARYTANFTPPTAELQG